MKNTIQISLFFLLLGASFTLSAQDYQMALGARAGSPFSISYKHFLNERDAIEVVGGTWGYSNRVYDYSYRWYHVGAAYLVHKPLNVDWDGFESLKWYFGGGGSIYFWTWDDSIYLENDRFSSTSFGIQGYIGLDYVFEDIPLNLSLDWSPSIFINGYNSGFGAGFGSLGIRYAFNQN